MQTSPVPANQCDAPGARVTQTDAAADAAPGRPPWDCDSTTPAALPDETRARDTSACAERFDSRTSRKTSVARRRRNAARPASSNAPPIPRRLNSGATARFRTSPLPAASRPMKYPASPRAPSATRPNVHSDPERLAKAGLAPGIAEAPALDRDERRRVSEGRRPNPEGSVHGRSPTAPAPRPAGRTPAPIPARPRTRRAPPSRGDQIDEPPPREAPLRRARSSGGRYAAPAPRRPRVALPPPERRAPGRAAASASGRQTPGSSSTADPARPHSTPRGVHLASERIGHREHQRLGRQPPRPPPAPPGTARSRAAGPATRPVPWPTEAPTRRPVKLPGPSLTTTPLTWSSVTPRRRSTASIIGSSAPAWRRAPARPSSTASPRARSDGHRGVIGRRFQGQPHQRISSPRRSGSGRWWRRNRRAGFGSHAPARSGHSTRIASPSRSRPSQSRSAASSGARSRKQSRWNTGPRRPR